MNSNTATVSPGTFNAFSGALATDRVALTIFEQKDTKPAIDDVICQHLDGSTLKNALRFIDYVRASKMKIKWSAVNVWSVRYRNKRVLDIIVSQDTWRVRLAYSHIKGEHLFSAREQEDIKNLIGALRASEPTGVEPIPAMS